MESSETELPAALPAGPYAVVLIDGDCALCSAFAEFVIRNDPAGRFRFAALGSPAAGWALSGFSESPRETVVLIAGGRLYTRSGAVLRTCTMLRFPWKLAGALLWVPAAWRDAAYSAVARWRRKIFPRSDACRLTGGLLRERLLTVPATSES